MNRLRLYIFTAAAAFAFTAFGNLAVTAQETPAKPPKAKTLVVEPAAAAPTKEALLAIEKRSWEGWKKRDPKVFEEILSDRYIGFGSAGRMDKAASIKSFSGPNCEIKSYSLSDEKMDMLGADVAILTFKAAQDYTCDGKKGPANVWSSSVYAREGDKWRNVFYIENPVTDPNAPAPTTAVPAAPAKYLEAKADPLAASLMAVETRAWDAWKNRDAKAMSDLVTDNFMYVSGDGRMDRAAAIKQWSVPKCEGLAYVHSEPQSLQLSKDVALVTYKADVQGTCDGKPTPPSLWVASFNQKVGDTWKNAFYTDVAR